MSANKLSRREFFYTGTLTALGAVLAACHQLNRLVDTFPPGATTITEPSQSPTPSPTSKPTLIAEAPPTATPTYFPTAQTVPIEQIEKSSSGTSKSPQGVKEPTPELHEAMYYRKLGDNKVQCQVCFRSCIVLEGGTGFCRNKVNLDGGYYTRVYGKPSAIQIDPIEKEPHFHMLPGGTILCTGTASCNSRCKFCQNWHLSQRSLDEIDHFSVSPELTVATALKMGNNAVSFTYNEPTVFYEHMLDVAKLAKNAGLGTLFHTNGGMQEKPLADLLEYMDAVTVDLKAFTPEFYREVCSNELWPVLRTLEQIHDSHAHLEIVNLVVTTLNDDTHDIQRMCAWIRDTLSDDVPLHFTRFFPAYKLTSLPATPVKTLESAAQIADQEGLKFVYIGNVPGHYRNSTFCPECGEKIIWRTHFSVLDRQIIKGKCAFCSYPIPGLWWDI